MNKNSLKVLFGLFIVCASSIVLLPHTCKSNSYEQFVNIIINGKEQKIPANYGNAYFDKKSNRIMVPVRYLCENLGLYIDYYSEGGNNYIIIKDSEYSVKMLIDSKVAIINDCFNKDKNINVGAPLTIKNGISYVPVRFISEVMGYKVDWERDKNRDTVSIIDIKKGNSNKYYAKNINFNSNRYTTYTLESGEKVKGRFIGDKSHFDKMLRDYRKKNNLHDITIAVNQDELDKYNKTRALEEAYRWIKTGDIEHKRLHGDLTIVNAGENLFCGFKPEICDSDAFIAWMNSPEHNSNLLCNIGKTYIYSYDTFEFIDSKNNTRTISVLTYGINSRFYFSKDELFK